MKGSSYRFLTVDEFNKPCHRHQILVGDVWKDATGGSTIVGVLDKPLSWWASGMAVGKLGWLNSKLVTKEERLESAEKALNSLDGITPEQYLEKLDEAYKAHSVRLADSAEAGTTLHENLEDYIKFCIEENGGIPSHSETQGIKYVEDFAEFSMKYIKRFLWSEAHCYSKELFLGGISDVGAEMADGSYAIIDFKSSKEAYFSHFIQASLYNLLIEANDLVDANGALKLKLDKPISKYYIIPFGAKEFTVHENTNVEELKEAARACVKLYRAKANFEK